MNAKINISEGFFNNLINYLPIPLLIIEVIQKENTIKLISVNNAFKQINMDNTIFPNIDLDTGDKLTQKFSTGPSVKRFDLIMNTVFETLRNRNGCSKTIYINIDKRLRKIKPNKFADSKSDEIRSMCQTTFFKVEENIVGIIFRIMDEKDDTKNLDFLKLNVLNSISTGAFVLQGNLILDTNLQFIRMLDYNDLQEIIGRNIGDFVYPPDLEDLLDNFKNAESKSSKFLPEMVIRFRKKEGEIIWQNLTFGLHKSKNEDKPVVYVNSVDVTERKKTEITLIRSHRLASIGDLTAGVAHEINNPLFALLNYSTLVKDSIDNGTTITTDSEEYEFLEGIIEESQRISKIVKNLSEFSKMGEEENIIQTNVIDLISKVEKLLAYNIRHSGVKIIKEIDNNFPLLYLPQYRLQHILFNLILNSIQSLETKFKSNSDSADIEPHIKISTQIQKIDNLKKIILKIYDNGEGIPDENMVKIFEPFFTTRRNKTGSGLGLNQVYNIIQDLNGKITVNSLYGEWTEFQIVIPVHEDFF